MKRKKVAIVLGVLVVLAAAGGAGFYFREELVEAVSIIPFLGKGSADDKVYVEKVSKIMNQSSGLQNRYNGIVETQDTYQVNVDSSRTIEEVLVKVGDTVEEGQELIRYDTSEIEMQIKQAQLELEGINNEIANYNKQIDQLTKERDAVGTTDTFSYTTEIQSLQNSVEQNKFDLESKQLEIDKYKEQLDECTVVSKQSGVVKEINESGMDSSGDSAAFMTILKTGDYRVKGSIDEQNVWTIQAGTDVIIRSRVDENSTWKGTITKVDTENTVTQSSDEYYDSSDSSMSATKYPFYIELESAEGLLLGQHVYIEMDEGQTEEKEGLWLYASYIVQETEDGEVFESIEEGYYEDTEAVEALMQDTEVLDTESLVSYVWVANEKNRLEKRMVELGEYDAELGAYEILSGLSEDDYIAWPMEGLYEGVTTVTNEEEVDYSSPLYEQEELYMDTEMSDERYSEEDIWGTETFYYEDFGAGYDSTGYEVIEDEEYLDEEEYSDEEYSDEEEGAEVVE